MIIRRDRTFIWLQVAAVETPADQL